MEDFNSSDIEFDAPQNPFHAAGQASVTAMLEHALEDRITSKRQVKELTFVKGSPNTQYTRSLWWNRFTEFHRKTLGKGAEKVPTSEDLERFFTTIVSRVQPRTNQVPAYRWLKYGVSMTIECCVFYYKAFTLSSHERRRIAALLDSLLQQGKVTQEPSWERNWAGTMVVRKLVDSLIKEAFQCGTMTWDVTLAKCLSVVLVAALGSRAGDVSVGPQDRHELPYLAYKDIVIKMKGGSTIDDLEAVITLRNEKGDKLDPKKKRIVWLKALKSPHDSSVCPVKLLLTLALRLGHVHESSIEDLIKQTAQRKNRTVLWSFPERPVHCAFTTGGAAVAPDRAAGNHQLTHTMAQAALATGILRRLRGHDLRRGAARDTANLKSKARGIPGKGAATVLGHSYSATNLPLTAHYVGAVADDFWTKRIDENFADPIYEMEEAEKPYERKFQALRPQQITEVCQIEGLDEQDPKQRKQASKLLEKRRQSDWVDQERRKKMAIDDGNESPFFTTGITDDISGPNRTSAELDAADQTSIDPQLLQQSQHLCNFIATPDSVSSNQQIEGLVFDTVQGLNSPAAEAETDSTLDFVRLFSTINISCNQSLAGWGKTVAAAKEKTLSLIQGNSRDKVTSFIYACKNHVHGCTFGNAFRVEINRHEQVCTITSREAFEALVEKEVGKEFKCTVGDCTKAFDTIGKLNSHVKVIHDFPKQCPKGCAVMLENRYAYTRHMETHSQFTPTTCLVPGCTSTATFSRSQIYRKHVRSVHNIQGKDIDEYMPYEKKAKFEPRTCGVAGCTSRATFTLPNKYKAHLRDKHSMGEDEIDIMVG